MKTLTQKAAFLPNAQQKFNVSCRKEKHGLHSEIAALVDSDDSEMKAVVVLRLYWPADTCYACVWTYGEQSNYAKGTGKAGGGGYHKPSAAAQEAMENAGFRFDHAFDGAGDEAMKEAVLAVAAAIGYPEAKLHVSHP